MKALVVYDSMFGNTAKVAGAIGEALRPLAEARVMPVAEATPAALAEADLLFVGSPTQRFRPLPSVAGLLLGLERGSLAGVTAAAFDTRIVIGPDKPPLLRFFVRLSGPSAYAAARIDRALRRAGARTAAAAEGFFVDGTEGPLAEGELERAAAWARGAAERVLAGARQRARGASGGAPVPEAEGAARAARRRAPN